MHEPGSAAPAGSVNSAAPAGFSAGQIRAPRKRHFIVRAIARDPWASFQDGLAFLNLLPVDHRGLRDGWHFADPRIAREFRAVKAGIAASYSALLPNIPLAERCAMASPDWRGRQNAREVMDDYWIFFLELGERIAERAEGRGDRAFVFGTTYHALVHGMYNAVLHGARSDIGLHVKIGGAAVTIELTNATASRPAAAGTTGQFHTRLGIHVGGGGNAVHTLAQLFDHVAFRVEPPAPGRPLGRARLVLRQGLTARGWGDRLKRWFLGRAAVARDVRHLYRLQAEGGRPR